MSVWDDLRQRLVVQYASEGVVRTSSPKDLDRFEEESGFRLPDDYREFAATFGPGTYGRGWQFPAPGFAKSKKGHPDLGEHYRGIQPVYPGFVAMCGKQDFHGQFAWDPNDITDRVTHDYGVYLLGGPNGEDSDARPIKVASTFREFVMSYALGGGFESQRAEYGYDEPAPSSVSGPVAFGQVV